MHANEARALTNEEWHIRQIRNTALRGESATTLEFVDKKLASVVRDHLIELGYNCKKIKEHNDSHGVDYTVQVSW